jgi:hypothetical protein
MATMQFAEHNDVVKANNPFELCCTIRYPFNSHNEIVGTKNRSIDAMPSLEQFAVSSGCSKAVLRESSRE